MYVSQVNRIYSKQLPSTGLTDDFPNSIDGNILEQREEKRKEKPGVDTPCQHVETDMRQGNYLILNQNPH